MEIDAGIAPECYGTPNSAAPNMGPRYSSDGAVQAVVRAGAKKIAFDQSNVPGTGLHRRRPRCRGQEPQRAHHAVQGQRADPGRELDRAQAGAGRRAATVASSSTPTPPEALKILQAAQQQGLQDRVKAWGCSTPCNTDFVAKALGQQWDGKLLVNAELNVTDSDGPQSRSTARSSTSTGARCRGGLGSFSQMGFTMGQLLVQALESIKGEDYSLATVNKAIADLKGMQDRHPLPSLVLRQGAPAHPEQRRLDHHPEQREDGDQGAVLQHRGCGPGDRPGARGREGRPVADGAERVARGRLGGVSDK